MRFCDEKTIIEKINNAAELIGTEKFYLKVGEILYKKGAKVDLVPDGYVTTNEQEVIEAKRIIEEQVRERHEHSVRVINPGISELVACFTQVNELVRLQMRVSADLRIEGFDKKEHQETTKEITKIIDTTNEKIEKSRKILTQNVRKEVAKQSVLAATEVAQVDDAHLSEMVEKYCSENQEIQQSVLSFQNEKAGAYEQAAQEIKSRKWHEKASDYVHAIGDIFVDEYESLRADPTGYVVDLAGGATYLAADLVTPGGIDNLVNCYKGKISLQEATARQTVSAGLEAGTGFVIGKIVKTGKIAYKTARKLGATIEGKVVQKLAAPKMHKHHIFNKFRGDAPKTQKYRDFFEKHNIKVDEFTVQVTQDICTMGKYMSPKTIGQQNGRDG